VKDLQAIRKGDDVYLRWTVPAKTTDSDAIKPSGLGMTRICRGYVSEHPDTCRDIAADIETKTDANGQQAAVDHVANFVGGNRDLLSYTVEVNNERGRNAGPSNPVLVFVAPSLAAPPALAAKLQPKQITLEWQAHELPVSTTLRAAYFYRIKRRMKDGAWVTLSEMPAQPGRMLFDDRTFTWENEYEYRVAGLTRVVSGGGQPLAEFEGEDSAAAIAVAHDIFPPPVPAGVQAVYSAQETKRFVDLTWSPNVDSDVAGYNVYRSEGGAATKLNADVITASAYRDESVNTGKTYTYSVTTVDSRGNESARSQPASERVPE
jgi:hypothetical protein